MVKGLKPDLSNIDKLIVQERKNKELYLNVHIKNIIKKYDIDYDFHLGIFYIPKPISVRDFSDLKHHFLSLGLPITQVIVGEPEEKW